MALTEEMIFWKLYDFEIEEKQCKGLNRAKKQTWMQFFFLKKLSETPGTKPIVAKLCMIDSKNRKIAEKLVQPVTPHHGCFQWGLQWGNS